MSTLKAIVAGPLLLFLLAPGTERGTQKRLLPEQLLLFPCFAHCRGCVLQRTHDQVVG